MSATIPEKPILVAACGNELAGDDAFGPLVAEELRRRSPPGLEVVTLGMRPAGLLDHLEARPGVLLVDAALPEGAGPPGTLIDMDYFAPDRPSLVHDQTLSSHGLSLGHELALARGLGMLPARVGLVAATVSSTELGDPVSEPVRRLVPTAADAIVRQVERWVREQKESQHA